MRKNKKLFNQDNSVVRFYKMRQKNISTFFKVPTVILQVRLNEVQLLDIC